MDRPAMPAPIPKAELERLLVLSQEADAVVLSTDQLRALVAQAMVALQLRRI